MIEIKENSGFCSTEMHKLSKNEAQILLEKTPAWKLDETTSTIQREFVFKGFISGMKFVNEVAELAKVKNHHPKIEIDYDMVTITFTTHSINGLSKVDFNMAELVEDLSKQYLLNQKSKTNIYKSKL